MACIHSSQPSESGFRFMFFRPPHVNPLGQPSLLMLPGLWPCSSSWETSPLVSTPRVNPHLLRAKLDQILGLTVTYLLQWGLPRWFSAKESACQCGGHKKCGFDPWVRQIPWIRKWQPLQYSCLKNSMDRGAWWAAVCGLPKSWT